MLAPRRDARHLQPPRRGRLIARRERGDLAEQPIAQAVARHAAERGMLMLHAARCKLHAERGASMRAKPVAALPVDPDSAKRYSRPHVSNDNPYPDSQFKTMTYRPDAPARFGCTKDAGAHCRTFFAWHNTRHRHAGTGFITPHSVHFGHAPALREARAATVNLIRCPQRPRSTRHRRRTSDPMRHSLAP